MEVDLLIQISSKNVFTSVLSFPFIPGFSGLPKIKKEHHVNIKKGNPNWLCSFFKNSRNIIGLDFIMIDYFSEVYAN